MATASIEHGLDGQAGRRWRVLAGAAAVVAVAALAVAVAVALGSGVALAGDASALARLTVGPFGGSIQSVHAVGPHGESLALTVNGDRLTPVHKLHPGEHVTVAVQVRRPGWLSWALGSERTQRLSLTTPVARVSERWITVAGGSQVTVRFQAPVSSFAFSSGGPLSAHALGRARRSVSLGSQPPTGSVRIAAAPRPWESLGPATLVSWFPPSGSAVMVSYPAAGSAITPAREIHLTFSMPVQDALGSALPRITPSAPGSWSRPDAHTLLFRPSGLGLAMGTQVHVQLPRPVAVSAGSGGTLHHVSEIAYTVPQGSTLRLQQLLAQADLLPVDWSPAGAEVPRTPAAEAQAAVDPPQGSFGWRYADTPHQLQAMWSPGQYGVITRGAVMKFENEHEMTADGVAGPAVWRALLQSALAGSRSSSGYSYVYVHREIPETMTLWHNGRVVLVSPANTGISGAETALGTYPVFEHIPEGTMSGTNPDGTKYHDPGIKWISYFNGGDALHNFDRASFGTPQSLGCVELPLAASAEVWPYTPIGTLVSIET